MNESSLGNHWYCPLLVPCLITDIGVHSLDRWPLLISSLMHKVLIYLHIIHLLKSSTCFEHYPAYLQEVYVVIVQGVVEK